MAEHGGKARWLALIDIDEFLLPSSAGSAGPLFPKLGFVYKAVLEKSIPAQIRRPILFISSHQG